MLSEVSQSQKDKHYDSMHMSYLEQSNSLRQKSRMVDPKGGGEDRTGCYCLIGTESVLQR